MKPYIFREADGTWIALLPPAPGRKVWNALPTWREALAFAMKMMKQ